MPPHSGFEWYALALVVNTLGGPLHAYPVGIPRYLDISGVVRLATLPYKEIGRVEIKVGNRSKASAAAGSRAWNRSIGHEK